MRKSRLFALTIFLYAVAAYAGPTCTIVADAKTGELLKQDGVCDQRVTPASTFKIALSLMGYDAGYLTDEHTPVLPFHEGDPDWVASWRTSTDPASWINNSVVWYSQRLTEWLGEKRFRHYVTAFQYGNEDISGLTISPLEQVTFLRRVVRRQLPVSAHAYDVTSRITAIEVPSTGWSIHGKTGTGFVVEADGTDRQVGWFVGWATKGDRTLVFARCAQDDKREPTIAGPRVREELMRQLPSILDSL